MKGLKKKKEELGRDKEDREKGRRKKKVKATFQKERNKALIITPLYPSSSTPNLSPDMHF